MRYPCKTEDKNEQKKLIICSCVANTFEWYDYSLFGNFASIIGIKYFPNQDLNSSFLIALLVFAAGYLMRPLGGLFFGVLGDKFGRKISLSTSLIFMSLPTILIGLLPTYESIGKAASVLIIVMRMLQGISMGGVLTGSILFLIENTDKKNRGLMGSIPMASICLGILLGTIVSLLSRKIFSVEDFDSWGWRIPFIISIVNLFIGLYIKKYTNETAIFTKMQKNGEISISPLRFAVKNYWFDMLVSIMISSTGTIMFYFQAIYLPNYLKLTRNFSFSEVDSLSIVSNITMAIVCILSGKIGDIIGKRNIIALIIITNCCIIFLLTNNFQFGNWISIYVSQIILGGLIAFYMGPEPALQAEFYPSAIRSTAIALSYNMGASIFGGTSPFIMAYLNTQTLNLRGGAYYIIIASFFSLLGLYFYKNRFEEKL